VTLHLSSASDIEVVSQDTQGQTLRYTKDTRLGRELGEFRLGLAGRHQVYNSANALCATEVLISKGWHITAAAVRAALEKVRFTGRFELLYKDPLILIDGGHNIEGVAMFVDNVKAVFPGRKATLFFGMLSDKQVEESVDALASIASSVYTIAPYDDRAVPAEEMSAIVAGRHPDLPSKALDSVDDAAAIIDFSDKDAFYVFCGSLYMIGDARAMLTRLIEAQS
jgi:dihydrofolate synthase/folylpolyglutamate synthase